MWPQVKQILLAIDRLLNTVLLGNSDETLSSRAWRAYVKRRGFGLIFKPLIDTLFFFQKDHCYLSYISERNEHHTTTDERFNDPIYLK